ncbi:hypothetical protein GCM10011506_30370 [Marivirga lumbricoides]|uniref:Glycosyl transferase family 1 n=1 Tax=Marivirga lumbricoides TaxID=1046115 RepID=A0ABQ1MLU5_9BACT|nr:hypothetical protein GCM10011506_30370 [Marivirga lumbricoides]
MSFLSNKNILIISPEPWDHIFVSKHHYATHLARLGNKIYYLNPASDGLKCHVTTFVNVFSVQYNGFIKGVRLLPNVLQKKIIRRKFNEIEELCQTTFDIVWSFDNSVFFNFSALPENVYSISHIVDWNQDFEFKKASETADLCLASSRFILEKQRKYNLNSFNIGHGFNCIGKESKQIELIGHNKINCGYAGNLDIKYLDWELVGKLVSGFPTVDFHFAGQWDSRANFSYLDEMQNFHYYGSLYADDLPSFYNNMDMLIVVYQYEKYPEQLANPHKIMEYLSSGKIILATWSDQYSEITKDDLIIMNKTKMGFLESFKEVKNHLKKWNNLQRTISRKKIAAQNSYKNQIIKIENLLK